MQFRLASIFAIVAAIGVSAQQLQINTPTNVIQCLPQLITWTGGEGPFFVRSARFFSRQDFSQVFPDSICYVSSVQPGGQPGAAALVDFGEQTGTSLTWVVNIPAGTSIGLTIRDQTGTVANSAPFTVGSSSDSGCLSSSLSVSEGSSTPAPTTTSAGSATTTAPSSSTPTTGTTSRTSTTSSGTTSAASETNAAVPFAKIGSAGFIGAFVAAVLA